MTVGEQRRTVRPPAFPPGVDGHALLEPCYHSAWLLPGRGPGDRGGSDYRRAITRHDPLLFAVTYLGRALRDQDTGQMSFSDFHLDAFELAKGWRYREPQRSAWVAPRRAGKSMLWFRANPLWALAHGWRRFFLAFAYTEAQAKAHLGNLLDVLWRRDAPDHTGHRMSDLLLSDFPELAPVRGAGGPTRTVLASGATIAAYGMGATRLGEMSGTDRPDLIIGDDLEPGEADYGPKVKAKAVSRLLQNVLPMNDRAAVVLTGTTTAHGSMMHDVVRAAKGDQPARWLAEERITPHYYPAILHEGTPAARSLWEQRWPLEQLLRDRNTRSFAVNMLNDPPAAGAGPYWTRESFIYGNPHVARWVLWVDPALSTHATSDHTAMVVAGALPTGAVAWVAHAEAGHYSPAKIKERIQVIRDTFPGLLVCVEENATGEENARVLYGLARHDETPRAEARKELRIRAAADLYDAGMVRHVRPLRQLEDVLVEYPAGPRDDLPDALAGALGRVLPGRVPR
jgi:hypothetical protein